MILSCSRVRRTKGIYVKGHLSGFAENKLSYLQIFILLLFLGISLFNIQYPIQGIQQHRQADTLMTGYLYCSEEAPFLEPRVSFRGNAEKGIAIGEFPIFSYLISLPCQVTGQWSDIFPKVLSQISLLLSLILWSFIFFGRDLKKLLTFVSLGYSIPMVVTFLSIPIPDSFALLMYTTGAYLIEKNRDRFYLSRTLGVALLSLGVLTRPYLVFLTPFLYFFSKKRVYVYSLVPCAVAYVYWYKFVVPTGELLNYYYVGMPPLKEMLSSFFPTLLKGIFPIIRDQFSIVGVVLIWFSYKNYRQQLAYAISIVLACLFLRGEHILPHQYYLMAATIIFLFLMTTSLEKLSKTKSFYIQLSMLLLMISSEQHHWRKPAVDHVRLKNFVDANTSSDARICTEDLSLSIGMYLAKRTGWSQEWATFKPFAQQVVENPWIPYECPPGALVIKKEDFLNR